MVLVSYGPRAKVSTTSGFFSHKERLTQCISIAERGNIDGEEKDLWETARVAVVNDSQARIRPSTRANPIFYFLEF